MTTACSSSTTTLSYNFLHFLMGNPIQFEQVSGKTNRTKRMNQIKKYKKKLKTKNWEEAPESTIKSQKKRTEREKNALFERISKFVYKVFVYNDDDVCLCLL